ncbi:MAG: ABC transporter permease [Defluviitaleaceae bacterium]|nr:ABC transporter permease [Defluviitaleaceae bacterium]
MTIFKYALLRGIRTPLSLIVIVLLPIAILLIPPIWNPMFEGGPVMAFGLFYMVAMSGAYIMSQSILTDQADGAIHRILVAPVTMRRYLLENLLSCMVPMVIQWALVAIVGGVIHDWNFTLALAVFIGYTILTLASVAMAFAMHCLLKSKEGSTMGFGIIIMPMVMLSGLFFPVEAFPGPLEYAGALFPVYWAVQAMNYVFDYGTMGGTFWVGMGAMVLFAIAFLLYGGKRRII